MITYESKWNHITRGTWCKENIDTNVIPQKKNPDIQQPSR